MAYCCSCSPFHFHSACMPVQLIVGCGLPTCKKIKRQHAHSLSRIDNFTLPPSSKVFWDSVLLISSVFCDRGSTGIKVSYWQSIELTLPIDPNRLQMQSLGQNSAPFGLLKLFRRLLWISYNWDRWPHLPSLHSVPFSFHFSVHGTAFRFCLDETEPNGNITIFWLLL